MKNIELSSQELQLIQGGDAGSDATYAIGWFIGFVGAAANAFANAMVVSGGSANDYYNSKGGFIPVY